MNTLAMEIKTPSVALVNAPYMNVYGVMNVGDNFSFPIGIGYIAAVLKQAGFPVTIFEPEVCKMTEKDVHEYFRNEMPDIVGITCTTPNFKGAVRIAEIAEEECNAKIVLGGAHASAVPEQILKNYTSIDFIVRGEGEHTMRELCETIKKQEDDFSNIQGLLYRNDGEVIINAPRPFIENLDELPFPARELVDLTRYRLNVHIEKGVPSATLITSRGCPARCTFCASFKTLGHRFRMQSAEYVVREIEEIVNKYDIHYIIFVDDTFTINKNRVKKICRMIIDKKLDIQWHCLSRVDAIDEDIAKLMKQAGCFSMLFGVESGNADILRSIRKGTTIEQAQNTIRLCNKLGYKTLATFILGLPGETRETIRESVDFAVQLSPIIASFNRLVPYPGTKIYEKYYKDKFKDKKDWDDFVPQGDVPVIELENVSRSQLNHLTTRAFLKFYLRFSQIFSMLKSINTFQDLKVYLRGGLGILRQILRWQKN